ncbi:MAG: site-specific DNA-methyltransferase, partial [Rickettsiales bacterium]|nr:site-specific DNA-methyltransferase [Rickettsiales bacterium]
MAPEVQNDCIALIEKDNKLSFESNALGEKLTHKLIIGENYDALKNLLAVYENKIDFIYIDPPYNTESTRTDGNSLTDIEGQNTGKFIYRDKYSRTGWLNMMNERLQLARKLLSDKGVIFISIDDNEQAYLKVLCDDVFGEENFVKELVWESGKPFGYKATTHTWPRCHEYILHYAKNINKMIYNPTYTLETSSSGKQILTSSIIKAKENGIYSMDWIQGAKESVGFGSGQKPVNLIKKL